MSIMLLTSVSVLLMASGIYFVNDMISFRNSVKANQRLLSNIIGSNISAAIDFNDQKTARETLAGLAANPHIMSAYVLINQNRVVFASYQRKGLAPELAKLKPVLTAEGEYVEPAKLATVVAEASNSWNLSGDLTTVSKFSQDGHQQSTIIVQSDMGELIDRFNSLLVVLLIILAGAILAAYFISARLQELISRPVLLLAETMKLVSCGQNYQVRATRETNDELGDLITGFNDMLGQIQERDRQLAEHRDGLERLVMEQTAELRETVEKLEHARDVAEESSRAKSQFLANMSHEIRTPMNGVLGMTELLMGTSLDERQRRFAETVRQSGESLMSIINDVLDFSKIEAGKMELESIPFDIHELTSETIELFADAVQRKGVELVLDIVPDLHHTLLGDPMRLRQVITNLASNAVKFTDHGEIVVAASVVERTEETMLLKFSITDTGIGISPEAQERIFNGFSQADGSMSRKYGGTGLGLTIARQLSALMGGEIGVVSRPGEGSCFWFTARFAYQEPKVQHTCHETLRGVRILIVDDNATNRQILLHQVESWGMTGIPATCGAEALAKLRSASHSEPFQMAILDMMMPEMDGIELASAIQKDHDIPLLRLVMLTSAGQFGDTERAKAAGIKYYLSKPVRQSWLYNCLLALAENMPTETLPHPPVAPKYDASFLAGVRILLVEDNLVNQAVGLAMLKGLGCRVSSALNGREALELLAKDQFDVVLMDCQMPEMDGYEATRFIRIQERGIVDATGGKEVPHQPIIALTAHALEGDREICKASGMDDYLAKPYTIEQLGDILSRWADKGRRDTEPAVEPIAQVETTEQPASSIDVTCSIDPSYLQNILALQKSSGVNLIETVISIYLNDSPRIIMALQEAVAAVDLESLKRHAHYFKSSSATLGATRLADLCKEIEMLCKEGDVREAAPLLLYAEQEFTMVGDYLRKVLKESKT
ncbi:MAG: response regulator [Geobacteraceae bacterium]